MTDTERVPLVVSGKGKSRRLHYAGGSLFLIGWVLFVLGLSTFLCGSPLWGPNCFNLGLLAASGLTLFGLIFVGSGMFFVGRDSRTTIS
jgi:hypothetical protein